MKISRFPPLLLCLALAGCSGAAGIAATIGADAPLVCPTFAALPGGAQVCTGIAAAIQGFFELWAKTHPQSATASFVQAVKAMKGGAAGVPVEKLVRVGRYGFFPHEVAVELAQPEMSRALDAYLAAQGLDAGAAAGH